MDSAVAGVELLCEVELLNASGKGSEFSLEGFKFNKPKERRKIRDQKMQEPN